MPTAKMEELTKQIQMLLEKDYIRSSTTPWGARIVSVKEKDRSMRLFIYFQEKNKVTVKNI